MSRFDRRGFIQGISASALIAALGDKLVSEALGQGSARKKFLLVSIGHGLGYSMPNELHKRTKGSTTPAPSAKGVLDVPFELFTPSEGLLPYLAIKDDVVVVDGLVNRNGPQGHSNGSSSFTCVTTLDNKASGLPGAASFDQYIAQRTGRADAFPAINLVVSGKKDARSNLASGRGLRVTPFLSATEAFGRIFGAAAKTMGCSTSATYSSGVDQSVLNTLKEDVGRMKGRLAGPERLKMDEFLESLREIESRQAKLAATPLGSISTILCPTDTMKDTDKIASFFDMVGLAFTSNLTRVATLEIAPGDDQSAFEADFSAAGVNSKLHGIGHGALNGGKGFPGIHGFIASNIVRLVEKLKKTPEGSGNAFDNTVIVFMSDAGDQHHNRANRYPIVVVGDGGGFLRTGGRYVSYPIAVQDTAAGEGPANMRALAEFFRTMSHAVGIPQEDFGKGTKEPTTGLLDELIA